MTTQRPTTLTTTANNNDRPFWKPKTRWRRWGAVGFFSLFCCLPFCFVPVFMPILFQEHPKKAIHVTWLYLKLKASNFRLKLRASRLTSRKSNIAIYLITYHMPTLGLLLWWSYIYARTVKLRQNIDIKVCIRQKRHAWQESEYGYNGNLWKRDRDRCIRKIRLLLRVLHNAHKIL